MEPVSLRSFVFYAVQARLPPPEEPLADARMFQRSLERQRWTLYVSSLRRQPEQRPEVTLGRSNMLIKSYFAISGTWCDTIEAA